MSRNRLMATMVGLAGVLAASPALSHPKLVAANPSPNATVATPRVLQLRFSEKLIARFSAADIVTAGGAKVGGLTSRIGSDGKTLAIVPRAPLRSGVYKLTWHVVSIDTHRVQGAYAFRVR